jgi:hypothetical protein
VVKVKNGAFEIQLILRICERMADVLCTSFHLAARTKILTLTVFDVVVVSQRKARHVGHGVYVPQEVSQDEVLQLARVQAGLNMKSTV